MHHPEPVGDESASGRDQFGELLGQCKPFAVVLAGLARVEPDVLQQQDIAVGQALGARQSVCADDVAGQLHVPTQLLPQRRGDRRQRKFGVGPVLRPAQVGGDHDLRTRVEKGFQRRYGRRDPTGIGDSATVAQWHIQVGAHQDATARNALRQKVFEVWDAHG